MYQYKEYVVKIFKRDSNEHIYWLIEAVSYDRMKEILNAMINDNYIVTAIIENHKLIK